jgi:hypothetical protein
MEKERYTHPSFGQIYIGRVSSGGNGPNFYGSELPQNNYITLEVYQSEMERELTKDWHYTHGLPLIKLRMSSGQFAEMITSLNRGNGTCCTIEMVDRKSVEKMATQESRKEFVHRKFKDRMTMFANTIREKQKQATTLVKKKTLSKKDVHSLSNHLEWLTTEVEQNIPYFLECFQEDMDVVIHEAKLEIENAIQHKINVLGLQELQKVKRIRLKE